MKKLLAIFILLLSHFIGTAQDPFTKKILSQRSLVVYRFKNLQIILMSNFTDDTAGTPRPTYKGFPLSKDAFTFYGPGIKVMATSILASPDASYPVDAIYFDSSSKAGGLAKLDDLEMRISTPRNSSFQNWKGVSELNDYEDTATYKRLFPGNRPFNRDLFHLSFNNRMNSAYEAFTIKIRNKHTLDQLAEFSVNCIGAPMTPFLYMWTQDSSSTKRIDSLIHDLSFVEAKMLSLYQAKEHSNQLRNVNLNHSSKLFLYFKDLGWNIPDSSLEYRLLSESYTDSSWIKSGHRLSFTNLHSGDHYILQVRYAIHPNYMQEHRFYIMPAWYQTTKFKLLIALLFLILLFSIGIFRYRGRIKKANTRKDQLSLELRTIRSRLNPHFIFNALSSIQSLINKKDIENANRYLSEFSNLMRDTLTNSDTDLAPLSMELRTTETYIKLEHLRFNFKYSINVSKSINQNAVEVPFLLLQPLVENSVRHGISSVDRAGEIIIDISAKGTDLHVEISDNGQGFNNDQTHTGYGLKLTNDRIRLLNETRKGQPIKIQIQSRKDTGTTVHLIFENWLDT